MTAATTTMLCWLWTTPLGTPVVPLVYMIAAGAKGSISGRGAAPGIVNCQQLLQLMQIGAKRIDLPGDLAVGQQDFRAAVAEDEALVISRQDPVHSDPYGAQPHGREELDNQAAFIGQRCGYPVAATNTRGVEQRSRRFDGPGQLGKRIAFARIDQCFSVRVQLRRAFDQIGKVRRPLRRIDPHRRRLQSQLAVVLIPHDNSDLQDRDSTLRSI